MIRSALKASTGPMKRTAFKRASTGLTGALSTESRQMAAKVKPVKCKVCPTKFVRERPGQKVCGPDCAEALAVSERAKAERKAAKAERANDRRRKEEIKTIPKLKAEAQKEFNAYVRHRDIHKGCIDCGKPFEPQKFGGSIDSGHYLGRGSADHLRFDERNVFGQRKNCNRPGGTTRAAFRAGVEKRIGREALEALEADQTIVKWTREDLVVIKTTYRTKLKELLKVAA
jgi:hypothetical protein